MFCRKCGNQIPDDSEFCPKCGANVETDSGSTAADTEVKERVFAGVKCRKCGEIIPPGNVFCPSCGENLPEGAPLTRGAQSEARGYTASPDSLPKDAPRKSKGRPKKGLFIGLGIAAVAVFCAIFIPVQVTKQKKAQEVAQAIYEEEHHEFKYLFDNGFAVICGYNGDSTDVIIPDTINNIPVKVIVGSSFKNTNITSLELNGDLEIIGPEAFENCKYLKTVTMRGESILKSIGEKAFSGCESLKSFDVDTADNCVEVGDYAFYNCSSLTSIPFGGYLYPIGTGALGNCKSLTDVWLYKLELPSRCFSGCENLTSVSSSTGVSIGESCFLRCKNLFKISIGGKDYKSRSEIEKSGIDVGLDAFNLCEKFNNSKSTTTSQTSTKKEFSDYNVIELAKMTYEEFDSNFGSPNGESSFGRAAFEADSKGTSVVITVSGSFLDWKKYSGMMGTITVYGNKNQKIINNMHLGENLDYYQQFFEDDVRSTLNHRYQTQGTGDYYELIFIYSSYRISIQFDSSALKAYAAKVEWWAHGM